METASLAWVNYNWPYLLCVLCTLILVPCIVRVNRVVLIVGKVLLLLLWQFSVLVVADILLGALIDAVGWDGSDVSEAVFLYLSVYLPTLGISILAWGLLGLRLGFISWSPE